MIPDYLDLRHCDNMELMAGYPDKHFDLAIVDPPYGIDRNGMNMGNSIFNKDEKKWDNEIPNDAYFKELFRVSKNQIIWGGNYFPLPQSQYFAIWDKGETMYNRDFAEAEYAWVSSGGTRIFKTGPNQIDRIHPTQKPIQLYKWLLKNYARCKECGGSGEVESLTLDCDVQTCRSCKGNPVKILDTHLGSMSIAIAVHEMNKQGMNLTLTGCELDEDYYNQAMKRVQNACLQQSLL